MMDTTYAFSNADGEARPKPSVRANAERKELRRSMRAGLRARYAGFWRRNLFEPLSALEPIDYLFIFGIPLTAVGGSALLSKIMFALGIIGG